MFAFNQLTSGNKIDLDAILVSFNKLPNQSKERYYNLYGPTNNVESDMAREVLMETPQWKEDVEKCLHIISVFRLNAFGLSDGSLGVFDDITRMSHSCCPNSVVSVTGNRQICRVTHFTKAGEELTISYKPERDLEHTHQRRFGYLQHKGFTCHCPRCDAKGDDTRQFNCCDPACSGQHWVCHPVDNTPPEGNSYTGVEYVEPYLLPCTVCQRSPPLEYKIAMFQAHDKLTDVIGGMQRMAPNTSASQKLDMLHLLAHLRIPRNSLFAFAASSLGMTLLAGCKAQAGQPAPEEVRQLCANRDIQAARVLVSIFPGAEGRTKEMLVVAMAQQFQRGELGKAREIGQQALRMHLVLKGRENRHAELDMLLSEVLLRLPNRSRSSSSSGGGGCGGSPHFGRADVEVVDVEELCVFCEESPVRVLMKRSRCGACKKVTYCSAGCQKAHWRVHKLTCGG